MKALPRRLFLATTFVTTTAAVVAVLTSAPFAPTPALAAANEAPGNALTAARFALTIDGYEIASFSELVGITSQVDVSDLLNKSGKEVILKKLPGAKTMSVSLRRGLTRNIEMSAWHELVILGDVAAARKSVVMTAYSTDGVPVARYHLTDAWPAKLEIGALKAGASEVLMETVTLTCEFIQRVSV